jgi:hypothetical protein
MSRCRRLQVPAGGRRVQIRERRMAAVITAIVSRKNIRITFFISRLPVCPQS